MLFKFKFLCGLLIIQLVNGNRDNSAPMQNAEKHVKPITLSVYYESLCPDSVDFLEYQILPLLKPSEKKIETSAHSVDLRNNFGHDLAGLDIDSFLDIHLIPYGKAVTLETTVQYEGLGSKDEFTFLCQHGGLECEGNKLHSCSLDVLSQTKTPSFQIIRYLLCTMKDLKAPKMEPNFNLTSLSLGAIDACFHELEYNSTLSLSVKEEIQNCISPEGKGQYLLKKNGDLTQVLNPPLYFVPWLKFNGVWSKSMMEHSQRDLRRVFCITLDSKNMRYYSILGCEQYARTSSAPTPKRRHHNRRGRPFLGHQKRSDVEVHQVAPPSAPSEDLSVNRDGIRDVEQRPGRRARFIHGNNDMDIGRGHTAWRWRTSIHRNTGNEWRWRRPIGMPILE